MVVELMAVDYSMDLVEMVGTWRCAIQINVGRLAHSQAP